VIYTKIVEPKEEYPTMNAKGILSHLFFDQEVPCYESETYDGSGWIVSKSDELKRLKPIILIRLSLTEDNSSYT
jgi:hypothetical protein